MSTPLSDLLRDHIRFADGRSDYLGEPTETGRAKELQDLRREAINFRGKYQHTSIGHLADKIHDANPDEWEEILNKHALDHAKGEAIRAIFPGWAMSLREEIKSASKSAEVYAELVAGVDTTETINTMITACAALRGTHHDISKAVDVDPVAFRDFREAGRKLAQLSRLVHFGDLGYKINGSTPEIDVALYAEPVELPELRAASTTRGGVIEVYYTDEDLDLHNQIGEARELFSRPGRHNLFLAELAAGRWSALTFKIAPTIEDLRRRAAMIAEAGTIYPA